MCKSWDFFSYFNRRLLDSELAEAQRSWKKSSALCCLHPAGADLNRLVQEKSVDVEIAHEKLSPITKEIMPAFDYSLSFSFSLSFTFVWCVLLLNFRLIFFFQPKKQFQKIEEFTWLLCVVIFLKRHKISWNESLNVNL